jgi:hypothetical protein
MLDVWTTNPGTRHIAGSRRAWGFGTWGSPPEAVMGISRGARLVSGIILVIVPTIMYGGLT